MLVLPVDGEATLISDTVEHRLDLLEIDDVRLGFNVPALVAKVLGEKGLAPSPSGWGSSAVEACSGAADELLAEALGRKPQLEPADEIVLGLRRRKSDAELRLVRNAARAGCECVTAMMEAVAARHRKATSSARACAWRPRAALRPLRHGSRVRASRRVLPVGAAAVVGQ